MLKVHIFKNKMDIYAGEYHLELIHVKGHTDGDLFIYIEALKTLITGDLIQNKRIPYMGDAYIEEWIKAINFMGYNANKSYLLHKIPTPDWSN